MNWCQQDKGQGLCVSRAWAKERRASERGDSKSVAATWSLRLHLHVAVSESPRPRHLCPEEREPLEVCVSVTPAKSLQGRGKRKGKRQRSTPILSSGTPRRSARRLAGTAADRRPASQRKTSAKQASSVPLVGPWRAARSGEVQLCPGHLLQERRQSAKAASAAGEKEHCAGNTAAARAQYAGSVH